MLLLAQPAPGATPAHRTRRQAAAAASGTAAGSSSRRRTQQRSAQAQQQRVRGVAPITFTPPPGAQQPRAQQQQPQQPPPPPPQQQQQQPVRWGYLTGGDGDAWTWDDDYNEHVLAKAAAAAQQLPPTPRQQQLAARAAAAAKQRPAVVTRLPEDFSSKVLSNGVLLVDKPARWSSADVVRQLKVALRVSKIGHAGPLDAQATGLLIVLLGAATRLTPKFEPLERVYTGVLQLGVSTTTHDAAGQVTGRAPWRHVSDGDLQALLPQFTGEIQQLPALWSSTKFKNRPLRWYAERGEEVVRQPKAVTVSSLALWREPGETAAAAAAAARAGAGETSSSRSRRGGRSSSSRSGSGGDDARADEEDGECGAGGVPGAPEPGSLVRFRVAAGKGASVRVLADDIGRGLGCGAHVVSMRREAVGGFSVDTAWSLEVLLPLAQKYARGFKHAGRHSAAAE